ncbi:hypothetical protein GIB67_032591 [Kingdonia uniflora]|uniref:Uncharacterized protein n=1 Tax=Kingdonia uniflora TaxID=39325 RepID=A0A7J7LSE2_9MAGN|nr:hypothetical protein GIB67_032591 [Kingdonia uniflora]
MAIQKVSSLHYEETSDGFSFNMMLSEEDPLYHKKKKLLHGKGFGTEETLLLSASDSPHLTLKVMLEVARVVYLDEAELYFGGVNVSPPIEFYTPKNELSSLNSILSLIDVSIKSAKHDRVELLSALHDATIDMIKAFGDNNGEETRIEKPPSHTEELLLRWGETHGVRRKLQIAHVEGAGRGFVAIEDLKIGDVALEIPESIVICEELVCDSYMIHILKEIDGISTETMMLLWSMKERYNLDSKFKIYFETLPATFNSGNELVLVSDVVAVIVATTSLSRNVIEKESNEDRASLVDFGSTPK